MGDPHSRADDAADDEPDVALGDTLYTEDGRPVGMVRGIQQSSLLVTVSEDAPELSFEHESAGPKFGEAELMWRCMNCGEMGEIDEGLPSGCPNCGIGREELMYWTED